MGSIANTVKTNCLTESVTVLAQMDFLSPGIQLCSNTAVMPGHCIL